MDVWLVSYGDEVVAIYSTEDAARDHTEAEEDTTAEAWTVRDAYES